MNSADFFIKIKNRLNKGNTNEYENLPPTLVQEAANKASLGWHRKKLKPKLGSGESIEGTKADVSDLNYLLVEEQLKGKNKDIFFISENLPENYFEHSKLSPLVEKGNCERFLPSDLREEGVTDKLLSDWSSQPSFDFEQSFHTIIGNKIKQYHNNDFTVKSLLFTYYKKPQVIEIPGGYFSDGSIGKNIELEFPIDVAEILVDETVAILSGDTENINQLQIAQNRINTIN